MRRRNWKIWCAACIFPWTSPAGSTCRCRAAETADVPDHVWELPTVLHNAGIDFLHIGVNDATTPAKVPMLFWWEGPDGSRLLTMLSDRYGSPQNPPPAWPYSAWLYVHMTYDNQGPPSPDTLQRDLDYYKQHYPGATVKVGQFSDFFNALKPEDLGEVPVVRADMPDCWTYGFMSSPGGCQAIAEGRPLMSATEFLATINAAWGVPSPNPQTAVAEAYEKSLLWSEHTWGLATQSHIHFDYVKDGEITRAVPQPVEGVAAVEASWQEKLNYALDIGKILAKPCADQLRALAAGVRLEGKRIVVFNPLPWRRDDVVHVPGNWTAGTAVQSDDGAVIPCEITGTNLSFVALGVPSMGYRAYGIVTRTAPPAAAPVCSADAATHTIESPAYRVVFDPARGRVVSLFDKRAGCELVDDSAPEGFGYFYQRFSKEDAQAYARTYITPPFRDNATFGDVMCRSGIPADQPHRDFTPANLTYTAVRHTPWCGGDLVRNPLRRLTANRPADLHALPRTPLPGHRRRSRQPGPRRWMARSVQLQPPAEDGPHDTKSAAILRGATRTRRRRCNCGAAPGRRRGARPGLSREAVLRRPGAAGRSGDGAAAGAGCPAVAPAAAGRDGDNVQDRLRARMLFWLQATEILIVLAAGAAIASMLAWMTVCYLGLSGPRGVRRRYFAVGRRRREPRVAVVNYPLAVFHAADRRRSCGDYLPGAA